MKPKRPDIEKVKESKLLIHARPKRVRLVMASLWRNTCYDKHGKLHTEISANVGGIFDDDTFSADVGGQDEEFPVSILSSASLNLISRLKRRMELDLLAAFRIPNFEDSSAWIFDPFIGAIFDSETGEELAPSKADQDSAHKEVDRRTAEFFDLTLEECESA